MKKLLFTSLTIIAVIVLIIITISFLRSEKIIVGYPVEISPVNLDKINNNGASGIVYHPGRKTLFLVYDTGEIYEIKTDGTPLKHKKIMEADFEGVACNRFSGLLYVAVENKEVILEVEPETFNVLREIVIDNTYKGDTLYEPGGNGMEGITFVPDADNPNDGSFYLTNQSKNLFTKKDPSSIFKINIPSKGNSTGKTTATILEYFPMDIYDLSDIYYDEHSGFFYVTSDKQKRLMEVTLDGKVLNTYFLPKGDFEGVTKDSDGFFYICRDSVGIYKFK